MSRYIGDDSLGTVKETRIRTNVQYFTNALKVTTNKIPTYPLTIVEAASGYGKTTCIRFFFKGITEADVRWVSFSENDLPEQSWDRLCQALKRIEADLGNRLFDLGLPNHQNIDEICEILAEFSCDDETYLILDNFQFLQKYFSKSMWEAFVFGNNNLLHIVAITQIINKEAEFLTRNAKCLYIASDDFKFNKNDISQYFKKAGLPLSNKDIDFLYNYSEGWIAPIYLQLIYYADHKKFQPDITMHSMIEKVVFNSIDITEKQILVSLSFFETFSKEQITYLSKNGTNDVSYPFEKIPLLSYDKRTDTYTFHSILREVLQIEFSKLSDLRQVEIVSLTAEWYSKLGNVPTAILMYCKIEQYAKALSLITYSSLFDSISLIKNRTEYLDLLRQIAFSDMDKEISVFPLSYILIAFEFFTQNCYEEYGNICNALHNALNNHLIDSNMAKKIKGELALIESFSTFNSIAEMGKYQSQAFTLLDGESSTIMPNDPWTFGNPSVVSLYWSEIGKIDRHIEDMDRCMPLYSAMVKGHGTGADTVFRAEIALLRGDETLAESLCYKGIFQAKSVHQESVYLAAVFVLQRVAILRGNKEMYELCSTYLIESEKSRAVNYELSEIALIDCYNKLQLQHQSLYNVSTQTLLNRVMPLCTGFVFCLVGRDLLLQRKNIEFKILYEEAIALSETLNSQLVKVYFAIYMTIAKMQENQLGQAKEFLEKAIAMALPDKILMPFAENYDLLKDLFSEMDKDLPSSLTEICTRYKKGLNLLKKDLYSGGITEQLTSAEYEVYLLAVQRKKNKEIAKELFVSENTVKTHLAHIYSKLGIKSKSELK